MSAQTVGTHRKRIMRKLSLHQQGQLMLYALRHGYVLVTEKGVFYPGFQRHLNLGRAAAAGVSVANGEEARARVALPAR